MTIYKNCTSIICTSERGANPVSMLIENTRARLGSKRTEAAGDGGQVPVFLSRLHDGPRRCRSNNLPCRRRRWLSTTIVYSIFLSKRVLKWLWFCSSRDDDHDTTSGGCRRAPAVRQTDKAVAGLRPDVQGRRRVPRRFRRYQHLLLYQLAS
jgi:hypothetical protein